MAERQKHGLDFEDWVRDTFTTNEKGPQNAKWDIERPSYKKKYAKYTDKYSGLPVSIKVRKRGQPIQFADVLRQYFVDTDFLLIVGIWEPARSGKRITNVSVTRIINQQWKQLFAEVAPPEGSRTAILSAHKMGGKIQDFVDVVKDKKLSVEATRKQAAFIKKGMPQTTMSLNQKINDEQRRVQCSLRFSVFISRFAVMEPHIKEGKVTRATLWGVTVPDLK